MIAFDNYVNKFDLDNRLINRKYTHSYRVSNISKDLATKLNLSKEDIFLAEFIGLIHDIGRFEQIKRYNTFNDMISMDHADFGVDLLFRENLIELFDIEEKFYDIIFASVKNHNKYSIDKQYDNVTMLHTKIIRDADKIDIINIYANLLDCAEIKEEGEISSSVKKAFLNNELIKNDIKKSKADWLVGYLSFIYDINFKESLDYIVENDFINKLYDKIIDKDKFKEVFEHIQKYILKEI